MKQLKKLQESRKSRMMRKKMKDRESSDLPVRNKKGSERSVSSTKELSNSDSKRRLRTRRQREELLSKA